MRYDGSPRTIAGSPVVFGADYGWQYTPDGAFVGDEPNAASTPQGGGQRRPGVDEGHGDQTTFTSTDAIVDNVPSVGFSLDPGTMSHEIRSTDGGMRRGAGWLSGRPLVVGAD